MRTFHLSRLAAAFHFFAAIALALTTTPASAQVSGSAYTSGVRYDVIGRVVGTIAPDPDGAGPLGYAAVRNTYDGVGLLTKQETGELSAWQSESVGPASWTGFTVHRTVDTAYDAIGRKLKETVSSNGAAYALT
jgi:hypothetical protein